MARRGGSLTPGAIGLLLLLGVCGKILGGGGSGSDYSNAPLPAYTANTSSYYSAPELTSFYAHSAINVRTEPRKSAGIVRTLGRGDYMQLGPKDANGWAEIHTGGLREGYVYRASDAVRNSAPTARRATSSGPARRASSSGTRRRSSAESRGYYTGPRGGCYTHSASGRKRYVDRSYCH